MEPAPGKLARIATVAAVGATVGDFGQLWTANAGRPELGLLVPPDWLIVVSTLLGAVGIPFYALGYLERTRPMLPAAPRRAAVVMVMAFMFAALGGSVHAVTGLLIHTRTGGIASGLDPVQGILASGPIVLTLWALALVTFMVAAVAEATLPQTLAQRARGPLVLTIAITMAASLLPLPWCDIVGPAAFNIAHVIFFAALSRRA